MTKSVPSRLPAGAFLAGLALALAGCQSGMTYGTGKSPGMQTLEDVVGIASLSSERKEPINYQPRPTIVPPPTAASLPPPSDANATVVAANWPVDPDEQTEKLRAEIARREAAGEPLPTFKLPPTQQASVEPIGDGPMTPEQIAEIRKRFAEARGVVSVDENGNPIRRYLTDPPVEYRMPDTETGIDVAALPKKKRKFLWWEWEEEQR
jgi:hypothetical protein